MIDSYYCAVSPVHLIRTDMKEERDASILLSRLKQLAGTLNIALNEVIHTPEGVICRQTQGKYRQLYYILVHKQHREFGAR